MTSSGPRNRPLSIARRMKAFLGPFQVHSPEPNRSSDGTPSSLPGESGSGNNGYKIVEEFLPEAAERPVAKST